MVLATCSRIFRFLAIFLCIAALISCATKTKTSQPSAGTEPSVTKVKKTSPPSQPPTFTPTPTPQTHYTVTTKVEGDEEVRQEFSSSPGESSSRPNSTSIPSPTSTASPNSPPSQSSENFARRIWRKFFSSKSISTSNETRATPTPLSTQNRPTEGFFSRTWHRFFPKKEHPPTATTPQWIGTIKLVNEREGYALIDSQGLFALPSGEVLNSVGNDIESGTLRVTPDHNAPFFIADILSGKPHAGDKVYSPKP